MVATSRRDDIREQQQADAERLLPLLREVLDGLDVTTSLTLLGVAATEILERLAPHARTVVARQWTARLLSVVESRLPVQSPAAGHTERLN
jgi:hypothetical protein